jgi:hypothetical protein
MLAIFWFPESCIRDSIAKLPAVKAKILVGHHQLDWLAEYVCDDLRRIIESEALIYLHGHTHEPISQSVRSTIGQGIAHQSGALFIWRKLMSLPTGAGAHLPKPFRSVLGIVIRPGRRPEMDSYGSSHGTARYFERRVQQS